MDAEEVAGFYAAMLSSDYMQKEMFKRNFFKCWRQVGQVAYTLACMYCESYTQAGRQW